MNIIESYATFLRYTARVTTLAVSLALVPHVTEQLQIEYGLNVVSTGVAFAQEGNTAKQQRKAVRTPTISNKVLEKMTKAQAAIEEKNYPDALKILDGMREADGRSALTSYELATLWNLYAFIYYSQEDYNGALNAYKNVVKQEDIPLRLEASTRYTIAQMYFIQERWQEGVKELKHWFTLSESPGASAYVLLAQGYYQLTDYGLSLENVNTAVDLYITKGKVPKEAWYNLQRFLYLEENNTDKVIDVLNQLLIHYPKKSYWLQLSHMYGEKNWEGKQLAALETAYVQDMLFKDKELLNMAYFFLNGDVPYKAATTLDKGIKAEVVEPTSKTLEVLGNAWRQSQEVKKAIPVMEQAAAKSDKGELYTQLGNVYLDNYEFKKAIAALEKGLKRGGVKRPDNAQLALGMSYFSNKEYGKAERVFKEAEKDERSEEYATQWLKYMKSEINRQKKLAEGL